MHACFSSERSSIRVDASSLGLSSPARTPAAWPNRQNPGHAASTTYSLVLMTHLYTGWQFYYYSVLPSSTPCYGPFT